MKQSGFAPIVIILGVVLVTLLAGGGYYYVTQKSGQVNKPQVVVPTKTADETVDWETYTNSKYNFQIKYPTDYNIREIVGAVYIYKGDKSSTPRGASAAAYPVALEIWNRYNTKYKSAEDACEVELCNAFKRTQLSKYLKKETAQINNALGIKFYSTDSLEPYRISYYLADSDVSQVLRIDIRNEKEDLLTTDPNQQQANFATLQKILSTFRFD